MENASKALIMAGGMILAILLLTLLIYAWSLFSKFQSSNDELADIEDKTKFNQQFSSYDRDDVEGYELISLVNQIIDYNERKTTDTQNGNTGQYTPITITIDINGEAGKFAYDNTNRLIENRTYQDTAQSRVGSKSSFEYSVIEKMNDALERNGLSESKANKVAKNIGAIFLTEEDIKNSKTGNRSLVLQDMLNTYNAAVGSEEAINNAESLIIDKRNPSANNYYNYACMFYEFMQFKRGIFKCINVGYDPQSGRVDQINFIFTGEIH